MAAESEIRFFGFLSFDDSGSDGWLSPLDAPVSPGESVMRGPLDPVVF